MSDNLVLFRLRDYRGATVEDLDFKPAISVNPLTSINEALEIAFENEFTYLPVIDENNRKLLGVLNVDDIKSQHERSFLKPVVKNYMYWFHQKSRENYEKRTQNSPQIKKTSINTSIKRPGSKAKRFDIITPMTPLEELASFFNEGYYFAIVTNGAGSIVYGVLTPEDLRKYENSRPRL